MFIKSQPQHKKARPMKYSELEALENKVDSALDDISGAKSMLEELKDDDCNISIVFGDTELLLDMDSAIDAKMAEDIKTFLHSQIGDAEARMLALGLELDVDVFSNPEHKHYVPPYTPAGNPHE